MMLSDKKTDPSDFTVGYRTLHVSSAGITVECYEINSSMSGGLVLPNCVILIVISDCHVIYTSCVTCL